MKILNEFGIKPTTTHKAAGYDFYIPNIQTPVEEADFILEAFSKSYNKSVDELKNLINDLYLQVSAVYGDDKIVGQEMNILMLYLAIDSPGIKFKDDPVEAFVDSYLVFDNSGKRLSSSGGLIWKKVNEIQAGGLASGIVDGRENPTGKIYFSKVLGWSETGGFGSRSDDLQADSGGGLPDLSDFLGGNN